MSSVPLHPMAQEPTPLEALTGLFGWLALTREWGTALRTFADGATLALASSTVAQGFQLGWLDTARVSKATEPSAASPLLAYPPALWWFAQVWRAAIVAPGGVFLIGASAAPFALYLACDLPRALTALADRIDREKADTLTLAPFARAYLDALNATPPTERQPIADPSDLDLTRSARITLLQSPQDDSENSPWLNRLRLSRLSRSPA